MLPTLHQLPVTCNHHTTHPPISASKPSTTAFLTKLGYPCTFPRAIVYAASDRGRLGFRHLGYEQGVQKCLQVIKHLRAHTTIGRIYDTTITHYQLMSGLSRSILVDTRPLPWSSARWIDQLRDFLHTIQGRIDLCQPWIPPPRQVHDRFIMDDVLHLHIPKRQAIQIQHV